MRLPPRYQYRNPSCATCGDLRGTLSDPQRGLDIADAGGALARMDRRPYSRTVAGVALQADFRTAARSVPLISAPKTSTPQWRQYPS
jgi:hypothetical protein